MTITHKSLLIPLPLGVTLIIETTADQPTFNIQTGGIVTGETATIDWGDGTSDDFTRIYNASHTYEKPGIYRIEISDVLSAISIAVADAFANYAAMVKALKINSSVFCFLSSKGLQNLTNIKTLDLSNTNVTQLTAYCCRNCTSLTEVFAPKVKKFDTASTTQLPFAGCTALKKIHFAAGNEAAITATATYQADPHLGAPSAEVLFDL